MPLFPLDPAIDRAIGQLAAADIDELSGATGAQRTEEGLSIRYLATEYSISLAPEKIGSTMPELSPEEHLLVLHYLIRNGTREKDPNVGTGAETSTADFVSYESLPGGMFYFPTFRKRGPDRLARAFGSAPGAVLPPGATLGGGESNFGDASIEIPVFPRISALVVLHAGEEEFPAECQMLFNRSISDYLTLEDIAVLGGILATKLTAEKT